MNSFDVAIIGAGAAGASTAFHLAKEGVKVILVEKNSDFIVKPCSGGMAASVQHLFPFSLEPVVDEIIKKVKFTWCLSDQVNADLSSSSPFWIVKREKLDKFISIKAKEQGADFLTSFEVKQIVKRKTKWVITAKDTRAIQARCVVIADGSNSSWPNEFGLGPKNLHYASTTSVRLEGRGLLEEGTSIFDFGLVHHGFAWAFPMQNSVSVGVGTFIGDHAVESKEVLNQLLPSLGFSQEAGARKNSNLRVWNGHSQLHTDQMVVVGDAASLCDPFLAEGLRPSIMSGCEAAIHINSWLQGHSKDLSGYTKAMKTKWGNSMAWGRRISQVFYRFPKIGYQLGIKRPTAPKRIAQILSGKMGYEDIAQRVIKRLLLQRSN